MRYSRQEILIGENNQKILNEKTIAVVGLGAIGSVTVDLLSRAGVNLIIIDRDIVELNNLQRQFFNEEDVEKPKALAIRSRLKKINSEIKISSFAEDLTFENINLLSKADLILDCTDNLETRFLINDFCLKNNKEWIYSAAIKTIGTIKHFKPKKACFKCIFKEIKGLESCETAGVLASTTMITASIQADMAIKILTNKETIDEMIRFDIKNSEIEKIRIKKINCEACKGKYEYLQRKTTIVKSCGEYFQITNKPINLKKLKNKLEKLGKVKYYEEYLQYKNIIIFNNGRALIKAKNEKQAKSDFSKFIGN